MISTIKDFVLANEDADISDLLLSAKGRYDFDISCAVNTIDVRRKLKSKVPSWYACGDLVFPFRLSGEQCSSEATALYKQKIISGHLPSKGDSLVVDLTGGLGVDSWAFSKVSSKVLYNEMNEGLAAASKQNFKYLSADNIHVCSFKVVPSSQVSGEHVQAANGIGVSDLVQQGIKSMGLSSGTAPDMIFLDPARRSDSGGKVFLLEDCSPDVISLKEELLEVSRYVLVKLSPMADISMILNRLGCHCRELHVVSAAGECKELLVLIDRDFCGECDVVVSHVSYRSDCGYSESSMRFTAVETEREKPDYVHSPEELRPGVLLFEPGKSLMKAGPFGALCRRFPIRKIGRSTHYFVLDQNDFSRIVSEKGNLRLESFGKLFMIKEVYPLNNKTLKEVGRKYQNAEVTARNLPMDTALFRKKLGVSSGNGIHIFGLKMETGSKSANVIVVTEPVVSF